MRLRYFVIGGFRAGGCWELWSLAQSPFKHLGSRNFQGVVFETYFQCATMAAT